MKPRRRTPSFAPRPAGIASLAMALACLSAAGKASADAGYADLLTRDGAFLRERAAVRATLAADPARDAQFRAWVDSLSVQTHRGRPQVITDFLDDSARVEIPPSPHFDYRDAFTFSVWIRLGASTMVQQTKIVSQAGVATGKVTVMGEGRRVVLMVRHEDESVSMSRSIDELPLEQWVHLCLTFSRSEGGRIYFDGEPVATRTIQSGSGGLQSLPEQPIYLGGLDRAFPGRIDDFRIYGHALDATRIHRLARGEDVRDDLLGHWPLDDAGTDIASDTGPWARHGHVGSGVVTGLPGRHGTSMGFDRDRDAWVARTRSLQRQLSDLIASAASTPNALPAASTEEVLDLLAARGAALLHYAVVGPGELAAWVLVPGASEPIRRFALPLDDRWPPLLETFRDELHRNTNETAYQEVAREIARRIWDPLEDTLASAPEIWLRLTPELHGLPFAALVDAHGRYLIERHAFARCGPVASLASRQGSPVQPLSQLRAVVLANPDFHALGDGNKAHLPSTSFSAARNRRGNETATCAIEGPILLGTDREVRAIVPLLEGAGIARVDVYDWDTAQEDKFDALAAGAGILHVATHGYHVDPACLPVTPADPLFLSGVVLAGAMRLVPDGYRGSDEGLLSGAEMAELDLSASELVVLSGCATATGMALGDEPLSGLAAAAWLAGARASVATLWEVSDEAMPTQIEAFYAAWTRGNSYAASVREALLAGQAMTLGDRGHTHPGAWAAIVAEGL